MGSSKTSKRLSVFAFFGTPKALSQIVLPLCADILLDCLKKTSICVKKWILSKISDCIAAAIEDLYCKACIWMVSLERIFFFITIISTAF